MAPRSGLITTFRSIRKGKALDKLLLCLVLLVSLALRLASLQAFLTIDEQLWALRSWRFAEALRTGSLADTYQAQHPGVVTMWLGTLAIALGATSGEGDLPSIVFGARYLAVLANWAGLGLMCLLIQRLFDRRVAWVATLLIGLDPFYLAHARLLHLDALLTTFATLSLLSLLWYLRSPQPPLRWLFLSASFTALASLAKSPGLLLFPVGALCIAAWGLRRGRPLRALQSLLLWGLVAALAIAALWPALWVAPGATLTQVWRGIVGQGMAPHENANFFLGHPTADPGPLFYPIVWLFRATPWVLLGVALSAAFIRRTDERPPLYALWGFLLLVPLFMTLGAKKFDRYLLPIFPTADLLAAWGLVQFSRRWGRLHGPLGLALLAMTQLALVLPHHPYYLSYYNPLAGGSRLAAKTLLVGWGEGMEQAAAYLNAKEDASALRVTAWYQAPLAPFFRGEASVWAEADFSTDYFVFYINELQRDPGRAQRYCPPQGPEQVIRAKGIDYAWVCSTDGARRALVEYLGEHVAAQDVILLSKPAPRLAARLPHKMLELDSPPVILYRLEQRAGRLWYVHEPYEVEPLRALDQQLGARCRKLAEDALPLAHITGYQLPPLPAIPTRLDQPQGVMFSPNNGDEQGLRLLCAELFVTQVDFRRQIGVTLEWVSATDLNRDLKIAWRVRDGEGRTWGGIDRPLVDDGGLRTSQWHPGTRHVTRHLIPLLPGLPPGPYSLSLTLYHEATLEPLACRSDGGAWRQTPYPLADIEVIPCPMPPTLSELAIPQPRREALAEGLVLLGSSPWPESVRPGEHLPIELFWEAEGAGRADWAVELRLQDAGGQTMASVQADVAGPEYPTSRWPEGERIRGRYQFPIPAPTPPGTYSLLLSLVEKDAQESTPPIHLGQITVQGREHHFAAPEVMYPLEGFLGQEVALLGYDLSAGELSPGEALEVTLYWQARGEMSTSYTVFVHLLDGSGHLWGQRDSLPGEGAWPTTSWVLGEVLADHYVIQVRPDAPPGEYRLEIGMYDAATGERRPAFDAQRRRLPEDRILLDQAITVW